MARMYVPRSDYFRRHRYDSRKIMRVVREAGGRNIRLCHVFNSSNFPKVVTFDVRNLREADLVKGALRDEFGKYSWLEVKKKNW